MPREYEIVRYNGGLNLSEQNPGFEKHQFVLGIFLPANCCGLSESGITIGHSVLWYLHNEQLYVISFTPKTRNKGIGKGCLSACCLVEGEYHDYARVRNEYIASDVNLYHKIYYKVSYLNNHNAEQKIERLREMHIELEKNKSWYKGFSTAICMSFCCLSGMKHNCTSVLVKLLPDLGLPSDMNYPLSVFLLSSLLSLCTAYFIALFHQVVMEQKKRTNLEIVGVTSATLGMITNSLYLIHKVLVSFCWRKYYDNRLRQLSWCELNALTREVLTQSRVAALNIVFALGALISLADCTCPQKDYLRTQYEVFEVASVIAFITFGVFFIPTFCMGICNGCTNPYALRNILDRRAIPSPQNIFEQPLLTRDSQPYEEDSSESELSTL